MRYAQLRTPWGPAYVDPAAIDVIGYAYPLPNPKLPEQEVPVRKLFINGCVLIMIDDPDNMGKLL